MTNQILSTKGSILFMDFGCILFFGTLLVFSIVSLYASSVIQWLSCHGFKMIFQVSKSLLSFTGVPVKNISIFVSLMTVALSLGACRTVMDMLFLR